MRSETRVKSKAWKLTSFLFAMILFFSVSLPVFAQTAPRVAGTATDLTYNGDPNQSKINDNLFKATGEVDVVVKLTDAPLSQVNGEDAKKSGSKLNPDQQKNYNRELNRKQDTLMQRIRNLGGKEKARLTKAHNALVVNIDSKRLRDVANFPEVDRINPLLNYELNLSETVPYIGATTAQSDGFDGTGIVVAVLDSGIDYTHKNLGGSGTIAAYQAAYGVAPFSPENKSLDGLFPTAKVIGGYDFVGETWGVVNSVTVGTITPDPDPIDLEGHGTHVADIIAGASTDGTHKGVAPGAKLLAVKVCSAISSACNGAAILLGVEFSLDPNGDGCIDDAVDIMNLSLGSAYGQKEDDLSEALAQAVKQGVIVVASAGNSGDRPYIQGSPAATPEVISVAQTNVPSAKTFPLVINSPASIAGQYKNTATLDWAPVGSGFTGDVVFVGRGCPADSIAPGIPADAYLANPAGKVALIDRGACNISAKVDRAAKAGAVGVLIGLVAPGDAVSFSLGSGDTFVPSLVITQATANTIKANIAAPVNVSVSPTVTVPLAGSMVGSSARGPNYSYNDIKPDIGAPGASISAEVGTGTGTTAFGGTSGAAPMVAGSAAILAQAYPKAKPWEIKTRLMNTAENNIQTNPATLPGVLAPITRIGNGEVRVDKALNSPVIAWDSKDKTGSLSFGYHRLTQNKTFTKKVAVKNFGFLKRTYTITPSFRYADDAASGAVTVSAPAKITVEPGDTESFEISLTVDVSKLPTWTLNGGSSGGNGSLLQTVEFDGYVKIAFKNEVANLAWHILPHKAAELKTNPDSVNVRRGPATATISSSGAIAGRLDAFSLVGTSSQISKWELPKPGDNFAIIDLKYVGVRLVSLGGGQFGIQVAINTYGERAHPNYPAAFQVVVDNNMDGTADFVIFNTELTGFAATGQNVVAVRPASSSTGTIYFFADADLNSANMILTAPLSALGLTPTTQFKFSVLAFDNYFTGNLTDSIEDLTYTLGTPRFFASGVPASVAPGTSANITIEAVAGGDTASPSQEGILLMYRDGLPKKEAEIIRVRN
jgi:subtilisin family serine protease